MMPSMSVKRTDPNQSLFVRFLRWTMRSRRSQVKAMEDALRLRRSLKIILLGSAMILMPSMLLAYFGISSIQGEELAVIDDVKNQAEGAADSFLVQYERGFTAFEEAVIDRLEAGRSPLEAPQELHPNVLVALKLDTNLMVKAPFYRGQQRLIEPLEYLFDPEIRRAKAADRRGEDVAIVSRLYSRASRSGLSAQSRARVIFDRARLLSENGRAGDGRGLFEEVKRQYGDVRDPWGFRMADLVDLYLAERQLDTNPMDGATELRALVDRMVNRRWAIGRAGEGAVAHRALSQLEPLADGEWVAATRERIDDRMRMLYWAEQLLPELDGILAGHRNLSVDQGKMRWISGDRGLWALTWWGEDLYAFGLDQDTVLADARTLAEILVPAPSPVRADLLKPGRKASESVLTRRSLVPWLTGWSMVLMPRDANALAEDLRTRRNRRIGIIVLAISMIGVGAMATVRLVGTELDSARMKADFAANVSHELRSPITQIRLKAESLMLGLTDTEEGRQSDYYAIVRESERLSRLVDNVLDFSAIERGAKTYALIPGDLGTTVQAAIEAVESSVELVERDLYVRIGRGLPVVAHDCDAIAQCVINLLSNAAKYSDESKPIHLEMARGKSGVVVRVIDQGIGIPEEDVQQIFEPFFRGGDASVRRRKGTGIGLAITFYSVSAHNGGVDVVSSPGEGSTFSLWFPAWTGDPTDRQGA
jgi:signal transduction histidine kinase